MKNDSHVFLFKSIFFQTAHTHIFLLTYSGNRTISSGICFSAAMITGQLSPAFFMQMEFQTHPLFLSFFLVSVLSLGVFLQAEEEGCSVLSLSPGNHHHKGTCISKMHSPAQPSSGADPTEDTNMLIHTLDHFLFWTMAPSLPLGRWFPVSGNCPAPEWVLKWAIFCWGSTVTVFFAHPHEGGSAVAVPISHHRMGISVSREFLS